jgi:hypothetical protein
MLFFYVELETYVGCVGYVGYVGLINPDYAWSTKITPPRKPT